MRCITGRATYPHRDTFWRHLAESRSIDLPGIIYATEIDKQKENILHVWYADKGEQDLSANVFVTLESNAAFIQDATDYIVPILRRCLEG